jgi:hypothetical protein
MVTLFQTTTLHDSDFVNRMKPIKLTVMNLSELHS